MKCDRCSSEIETSLGGAALCPACLMKDVRAVSPDAAWVESRFPQLEDPEAIPSGESEGSEAAAELRFSARDFESGQRVVLYLIRSVQHDDLPEEIEKRSQLDHPRIARLLDHGEVDGFAYAIEAVPPGAPLSDSIRDAGISRSDVLGSLPKITDAVRYAATQGVSLPSGPGTIYVGGEGQVTLTGIAVGGQHDLDDPTGWLEGHPSVGTHVGNFELLGLLGEGGFAEVYRARQERPMRREVALKILKLGMDTRQVLARFAMERQALAQMAHSGIAKIYDAGATESGRPYIAMELVEGEAITGYCDGHQLPLDERARLLAMVCRAVDHGHAKGVIHRDLKPSNVLVAQEDGKPVPKVIDFGIARATEEPLATNTFFTRTQQFVGSPSYMSPEQVDGSVDVDVRSDVYSLGCLFYELLTGEPPLPAAEVADCSLKEMIGRIQDSQVQHPADRVARFPVGRKDEIASACATTPRKLERALTARGPSEIALKALSSKPASRYPSAAALADDLEAWADDDSVAAPRRHRRAVRRIRTASLWVLALLGVVVFAWQMSPFSRRTPTSRDADGSLRPVALFQFSGDLKSAIRGGPDMEVTGEPDLKFETAEIAGGEAEVLHFPRFDPGQWLKVKNVIGVNGPPAATESNRWTLVYDVMFPDISGTINLLQCHSENKGPGEIRIGSGGIGSRHGLRYGFVREGEWNRIVVTSTDNGRAQLYTFYINGTRIGIPWVLGQHSAEYAFDDEILLFCEGDNHTGEGFVNSFAIYDQPLTDAEVRALGSPAPDGIPAEFKPSPPRVSPATLVAEERISPSAGTIAAHFGSATAMRPGEVWIAGPQANSIAKGEGEVRRFLLGQDGRWAGAGRVSLPENLNPNSRFGSSVAMLGSYAAVGAPGVFGGGSVYLYHRGADGWSAPQSLVGGGEAGPSKLGSSVAIVSSCVAASAVTPSGTGVVLLFDLETGREIQRLEPGGATGLSLAAAGEILAVGSADVGIGIFVRDGATGQWGELAHIPPPASSREATTSHIALSVDGGWLAASGGDGQVQLYRRGTAQQANVWQHHSALTEPNPADAGKFGSALTFASPTRLLIGAPHGIADRKRTGAVFLYELEEENWQMKRTIAPAVGSVEGRFGGAIAAAGNRVWIGAEEDHTDRHGGGAAYPVDLPRFEDQRFPTLAPNRALGAGIAIGGGLAAVSIPGFDRRVYGGELQIFSRQEVEGSGEWRIEYRTPESDHTDPSKSAHGIVALDGGNSVCTTIGGNWQIHASSDGTWAPRERIEMGVPYNLDFDSGHLLFQSGGRIEIGHIRSGSYEVLREFDTTIYGYQPHDASLHGDVAALWRHSGQRGIALFRKESSRWEEDRVLPLPDDLPPGIRLGSSIDHDDRWLITGAPTLNKNSYGIGSGAAYIYELTDPDRPPARLHCPESREMPGFGRAVAVRGDLALVGNHLVDRGLSPGRVYLYRHDPSNGRWHHAQTLQAANAEAGDEFGLDLALDDDGWAMIGAMSSWVYFFHIGE